MPAVGKATVDGYDVDGVAGGPRGRRRSPAARVGVAVVAVLAAACSSGRTAAPVSAPRPRPTTPVAAVALTPRVAHGVVAPLTGLPTSKQAAARPALSVKVDNVAGALPQSGLQDADLVVDTPVEGGLTRLFVVFQSHAASVVGPIRSARPVDADLLTMLRGGVFAYSGADRREIRPVQAHGGAVLVSNDAQPQYFHRDPSRPAPHDVVSSTTRLYAAGQALGSPKGPPPQPFTFATGVPVGPRATSLDLSFGQARAAWRWNGTDYLRTQDGRPDVLRDGARVTTTNIVVLGVRLAGTGIHDAAGNEDPLVVVTGSGACTVLRDGVVVTGTWHRPSYRTALVLRDTRGKIIALKPGRTWVELLPRGRRPLLR